MEKILEPLRAHEGLLPAPRAAGTGSRTRVTHHALMHSLCLRVRCELRIHGHVHLHLHLHHGRHLGHLPVDIVRVGVSHSECVLLGWVWRGQLLLRLWGLGGRS